MLSTKRCALSRCALALELVMLLAASNALCDPNIDPSFFHMKPRLGHFQSVEGYLKIYEEYFGNVIKLTDKSVNQIDINDWRNVRPTGEFCVNFLQAFQVRGHRLHKPFDIIPLDSCLDWLINDSDAKKLDLDKFNTVTKEEYNKLSADTKLKNLFDTTGFKGDKIPAQLKEKLHDYFGKLLKIYANNPKNGCHSLWLEAYNDFIEDVYLDQCEDEVENCTPFGLEGSDDDSYLKLIVDSTKQAAFNCYNHVTQRQMAGLISAAFEQESKSGLYNRIKTVTSGKVPKQTDSTSRSREMINILHLVTGSDPEKPIQLPLVVQALNKLKNNEPETVEKFTEAIGKYANQNVNLKDSGDDPDGRARFGRAMTKLCRPYIDPKLFLSQTGGSTLWEEDPDVVKKAFEFYNLIYSLVRLTNYPSIFGITKEKFEEDVLAYHWESLYLATFSCQIISTTWGQLDYDTNQDTYKVYLRPSFEVTIEDWPISVLYQRLGSQKVEVEKDKPVPVPGPSPDSATTPSSGPKGTLLPKIPKIPKRTLQENAPPMPAPKYHAKPIPKPVVNHNPEPSNADDSKPTTLKFKNPLKKGVKTSLQSMDDYESDVSGGLVPLDSIPDEKYQFVPEKPQSPRGSHQISPDTAEMFKRLHGRYPQGYVPPPGSSISDNRGGELEKLASKAQSNNADWDIPVAFDFNQKFVPGASKFGSAVAKPSSNNKWSDVDVMSF